LADVEENNFTPYINQEDYLGDTDFYIMNYTLSLSKATYNSQGEPTTQDQGPP
jgi:hypothetical protein